MFILISEVVTTESAGAAGMVGVVLALVAVIRVLVVRRNGHGPPSKDDVKRIVAVATTPTEHEIVERRTARDRIAKLSRLADENTEHQRQMLLTTRDMLRYTEESAQNTAAILASINQTNEMHKRSWATQDRALETMLQVNDRTARIEDKLTQ